jgi:hypothetical protein
LYVDKLKGEKTMSRNKIQIFSIMLLALALTAGLVFVLSKQSTRAKSALIPKEQKLVAHEWGTFTSIAGQNGVAIDWRPLNGASDLPKFVYSVKNGAANSKNGIRIASPKGKESWEARIRMETPVIYFYTDSEMEVSVNVDFPRGHVTEWYPQARTVGDGVNWGRFKLMPNADVNFLKEKSDSHYYPARETDATPLRVCDTTKTKNEYEKFLFYRGIGNFDLPLTVKLNGEQVVLGNRGQEAITNLIVFENRGSKIGFNVVPSLFGEIAVNRPVLNQPIESVLMELERTLIAQGLYEKEARAMIKTWRDSWFEEGLRVFYVLPRKTTDEILPLTIDPKPPEIVRVLVGRAEVITPEVEKEVKTQVELLRSSSKETREEAIKSLRKHGRFYEPILKSILQKETDAKVKAQIEKLIAKS